MNGVSCNSAILRDALEQQDSDEPKTILEIGVSIKRSPSSLQLVPLPLTETTTPPAIITRSHSLVGAQSIFSRTHLPPHGLPIPTSTLHHHLLNHHLPPPQLPSLPYNHQHLHHSNNFTPIHHRPHQWTEPNEMTTLPHSSSFHHTYSSSGSIGPLSAEAHPTQHTTQLEQKNGRTSNATWKDRAIQIERGNINKVYYYKIFKLYECVFV